MSTTRRLRVYGGSLRSDFPQKSKVFCSLALTFDKWLVYFRRPVLVVRQPINYMDFVTVLGFAAALLTTFSFLPQMIKTWQSKSAKDVSFVMLIFFNSGILLWLIYGIILQQLPVIFANAMTLFFNMIILWLKIKYR
jgi:MtN3 and saliva related transmembrane protein